jgi:NTE family protein
MSAGKPIRVAIACQGGGSHTAFTAGVLSRLFQPDVLSRYRVVGLSGTSGGAICALLAWSALLADDPQSAEKLLAQFWSDNSASTPSDRLVNAWIQWASQLSNYVVAPAVSPYDTFTSDLAEQELRALLERSVDFEALGQQNPGLSADPERPLLLLGAVDVVSGDFKAFDSRKGEITAEAVLASAALPTLFRAVHTGGGVYWDGLFSQNPPLGNLLDVSPDEIWVIRINPKEVPAEPRTVAEIADRRNELAGNLSLYQELHMIEKIDELIDNHAFVEGKGKNKYRHVTVRMIEMARTESTSGPGSKLNRDPAFLDELEDQGRTRACEFVDALGFEVDWRAGDLDALAQRFADDCEVESAHPFKPFSRQRGAEAVQLFIARHLTGAVQVDLTHKQVSADRVIWQVRSKAGDGERLRGQAEARFEAGKVTSIRLGALP